MSHQQIQDYYEVLGLPASATAEQIRAKYRRMAQEYHTDTTEYPKAWAEERIKQINLAWSVLRDPVKRASYDASRSVPIVTDFASPTQESYKDPQSPTPNDAFNKGGTSHTNTTEEPNPQTSQQPYTPNNNSTFFNTHSTEPAQRKSRSNTRTPFPRIINGNVISSALAGSLVYTLSVALPWMLISPWRPNRNEELMGLILATLVVGGLGGLFYPSAKRTFWDVDVMIYGTVGGSSIWANLLLVLATSLSDPKPSTVVFAVATSAGCLTGGSIGATTIWLLSRFQYHPQGTVWHLSTRIGSLGGLVGFIGVLLLIVISGQFNMNTSMTLVVCVGGFLSLTVGAFAGGVAGIALSWCKRLKYMLNIKLFG